MSDRDPLRARFETYRGELTTHIDGPGPEAARRTLRRRRRTAVTAGAALAVVLVVAPIAAGAALRRDPPLPPAVTPTAEPTPSPSVSPSVSPAPTPSASRTPDAPDGRISEKQLLAARVDLPDWFGGNCADNAGVRLLPGSTKEVQKPYLIEVTYGDVDADGAQETAALLGCRIGEASAKQVVVFDRDGQDRIVTVGRVVRTEGEGPEAVEDLLAVSVPDGSVRVKVADLQPCCSTPAYWARQQWRTYGWDGTRFAQNGGPTGWGRDPRLTDLRVTAGPLILGPADGTGAREGTVKVTVSNRGRVDVPRLALFELNFVGTPEGGAWDSCEPDNGRSDWPPCMLPGLAAGKQITYTFRYRYGPAGPPDARMVRAVHYDDDLRYWRDLTPQDNWTQVRLAG
ncbi:hypothetical protein ACL02O_00925 [Micromonospora sp. MS34]|uniref:hypothetical protein n=1 Tax=Micromonospora sp. MS34 TaxID=3385971 RepID=UPI0039A26D82